MTPEIRTSIRKRDGLHKKAKRVNTDAMWEKYREKRNKTITEIRETKESH